MAGRERTALSRDQARTFLALLALALLAWSYVYWYGAHMSASEFEPWTYRHFLSIFAMWTVMMVAMMTPAAAPVALIYARIYPQGLLGARSLAPAAWFTCGYLCAWTLFAAAATLAQWRLEALAVITPMMAGASRRFSGAVLIAAGVYQWLPIKDRCLAHCRAPLSFIQRQGGFRAGALPALRLGFRHGLYCVGCCWLLMALLFVVGVMNLLWIAALMVFVLLEKLLPRARYFTRIAGLAAVVAGIWMIYA